MTYSEGPAGQTPTNYTAENQIHDLGAITGCKHLTMHVSEIVARYQATGRSGGCSVGMKRSINATLVVVTLRMTACDGVR